MKVYVLMGHRKEQHPGQYAPEVLAAIDEIGNEDNPDYLIQEKKKYDDSNEFDALTVICLKVSNDAIDKALYPDRFEIPAEVMIETEWWHSVGIPTIVSPVIDDLTAHVGTMVETDNSNGGSGENYAVSIYCCRLCGERIKSKDARAHHFISCSVMRDILPHSDGIQLLMYNLKKFLVENKRPKPDWLK